tara:strand:+ start:1809 stop:2297 length:489 start_codon:yes stop_codon:yes gene_type:complete
MKKRENLLWQLVLIVGLLAILFNGYKLYNMNNDVIQLWENFEKEEIGTDKKLNNMVERLEINLEERLNSTFEIEPDKNPSNLETVYPFGDRERIGNKHFSIKSCGKNNNGEYCIITLRKTTEMPRVYKGDKIAGGTITEVDYKENRIEFEKDGKPFTIRKEK